MVNLWTGIGRLGADPEIRSFENGDRVANFSIACSEQYKDKNGEKKEITQWVNIVVFGKLVDVVESYVKKGSLLYLAGKLKNRSYESDGTTKYITEIVLEKYGGVLKMLDKKSEGENNQAQSSGNSGSSQAGEPLETDDLPFW